jgi:hypothetical protein
MTTERRRSKSLVSWSGPNWRSSRYRDRTHWLTAPVAASAKLTRCAGTGRTRPAAALSETTPTLRRSEADDCVARLRWSFHSHLMRPAGTTPIETPANCYELTNWDRRGEGIRGEMPLVGMEFLEATPQGAVSDDERSAPARGSAASHSPSREGACVGVVQGRNASDQGDCRGSERLKRRPTSAGAAVPASHPAQLAGPRISTTTHQRGIVG